MRKIVRIGMCTMVWLVASPTLRLPDRGAVEVGAPPASAETVDKTKPVKRKKPVHHGSPSVLQSTAPGLYPMQPIMPPKTPEVTGTVTAAPSVPGYPKVPTVPIVPQGATGGAGVETSQDRVARCIHQGALGGLPADQRGAYMQVCAFQ